MKLRSCSHTCSVCKFFRLLFFLCFAFSSSDGKTGTYANNFLQSIKIILKMDILPFWKIPAFLKSSMNEENKKECWKSELKRICTIVLESSVFQSKSDLRSSRLYPCHGAECNFLYEEKNMDRTTIWSYFLVQDNTTYFQLSINIESCHVDILSWTLDLRSRHLISYDRIPSHAIWCSFFSIYIKHRATKP